MRALGTGGKRGTALTYYTTWDDMCDGTAGDNRPQDFHARISRNGRSRGLARPRQRKLVYRRMGVLAAAIAVPAMAAPQVQQAPQPQVIRFVMPQAQPYMPALPRLPELPAEPVSAVPALSPAAGFSLTKPAPALALAGSYTDRRRAEQCLTMAVYYEAASESDDGQRAVAQVVLNRVNSAQYPASVCGVVFQGSERSTGCQFTFTCDGSLTRSPSPAGWLRAGRVARSALGGFVFAPVGTATHYHTTAVHPYWAASLSPVGIIGAHVFYTWRGAAGLPSAFQAIYRGHEPLPVRNLTSAATAAETGPPVLATTALPANAGTILPAAATPVAAAAAAMAAPDIANAPGDRLPQSGAVLDQYANSGRWLREP